MGYAKVDFSPPPEKCVEISDRGPGVLTGIPPFKKGSCPGFVRGFALVVSKKLKSKGTTRCPGRYVRHSARHCVTSEAMSVHSCPQSPISSALYQPSYTNLTPPQHLFQKTLRFQKTQPSGLVLGFFLYTGKLHKKPSTPPP